MVKRILAVDDDKSIIKMLQDELQSRLPDTEILATNSGLAALNLLLGGSIDLLITDIAMPDMNGYELYKRAKETNEELPVIMITGFGYDPSHAVVNAKRDGLENVFFKPFDMDKLEKKVRESLDI